MGAEGREGTLPGNLLEVEEVGWEGHPSQEGVEVGTERHQIWELGGMEEEGG